MRFLITLLTSIMFVTTANALTIPKGHVLGPDGNVYKGASPDQIARLIALGKAVGTHGRSVYIIYDGTITFIPFSELIGKSKDERFAHIIQQVTDTILAELAAKLILTIDNNVDETSTSTEIRATIQTAIAEQESITLEVAEEIIEKAIVQIVKDVVEETEEAAEEAISEAIEEVVTEVVENVVQIVLNDDAKPGNHEADVNPCGLTCGDHGQFQWTDGYGHEVHINIGGTDILVHDGQNEPMHTNPYARIDLEIDGLSHELNELDGDLNEDGGLLDDLTDLRDDIDDVADPQTPPPGEKDTGGSSGCELDTYCGSDYQDPNAGQNGT